VDDGSTDRTAETVRHYMRRSPWIELVQLPRHHDRNFAGKAFAFNTGFKVFGFSHWSASQPKLWKLGKFEDLLPCHRIGKLLDFFGVSWQTLTISQKRGSIMAARIISFIGKAIPDSVVNGSVDAGVGTGLFTGENPVDLFLRASDCALPGFWRIIPLCLKKQSLNEQQRLDLRRLS